MGYLAIAVLIAVACAICFYRCLRLAAGARTAALLPLMLAIALSPLMVPRRPAVPRLLAALAAVIVGVKTCDLHVGALAGVRPPLWQFLLHLFNPFAVALRKVLKEPLPPWRRDMLRVAAGAPASAFCFLLLVRVFQLDWRKHPFAAEHCAKLFALFLLILIFANTSASAFRLVGMAATDFSANFFLARTPAQFWRCYNRPAAQFLHEDIFKPLGGLRRPVVAMFMTFVVSAVVHEYLFDIAAGRILGWQLGFFLIQGIATVLTADIRPRRSAAAAGIILTLAFNLATGVLFFRSANAVIPFYVRR